MFCRQVFHLKFPINPDTYFADAGKSDGPGEQYTVNLKTERFKSLSETIK
jgi:hypothetical protein